MSAIGLGRRAALLALAACGRLGFGTPDAAAPDAAPDAADPQAVVALSAGGPNTCVRLGSGEIWCWGRGDQGGTGRGAVATSGVPARVPSAVAFDAHDTNDGGTCARTATSGVFCWGFNDVGQLGVAASGAVLMPTAIVGTDDVVEVAVGNQVTCVRRGGGRVACAGAAGLLGDGSQAARDTFGDVTGVSDAVRVTAGDLHACVLHQSGAVSCWGQNTNGQLGDGTMQARSSPVAGPFGPYSQIVAGDRHTCGLRGGNVECWGLGTNGQLGDGATVDRTMPVVVAGLVDAVELAAPAFSSCARRAGGTVVCWGRNASGELGDGTTTMRTAPVAVVGLTGVVELSARTGLHACARTTDGTVWCWGDNSNGQLGIGAVGGTSATATGVPGLP